MKACVPFAMRPAALMRRPAALVLALVLPVALAQRGRTSSSTPTSFFTTTTSLSSVTIGPSATPTSTDGGLTGFPTLTGPGVVPTYPAASVPPTAKAPFMRHTNLPDGTVFIAVGVILGTLGLALLLWRSIVTLMLRRSVERAAMAQREPRTDNKANLSSGPPAPFYKYTDQASSMSLNNPPGRGVRRTTRVPVPSSTPSQSNLFFSPTAGAGTAAAAPTRSSTFLPSGFYAAGAASPSNQSTSINMSNLRLDSRGHYHSASRHTLDTSPPDTPPFGPRRDPSSSSLNVNLAPGQRAPSVYLEDLLTDDPSTMPPPPSVPLHQGTRRNESPSARS